MLIQANSIPIGSLSDTSGRTGDTLKCFSGCFVQSLSLPAPLSLASSFQNISVLPNKTSPCYSSHNAFLFLSPPFLQWLFRVLSPYPNSLHNEITTVLSSPVISLALAPIFHDKNLRNSKQFFIGDIGINMDSNHKIRGENNYISWGFYSLHARSRMISMELPGMSIILKQSNGVCEDNWRIIVGTQQRNRTCHWCQIGDFPPN